MRTLRSTSALLLAGLLLFAGVTIASNQPAHALVTVATISGQYNFGGNDTPNLFIHNPSAFAFTHVRLTGVAYQGINTGLPNNCVSNSSSGTQCLTQYRLLPDIPANTNFTYTFNEGPHTCNTLPGDYFANDYDDSYGCSITEHPGNVAFTFQANWDNQSIFAQFSPHINDAHRFVGFLGLDQNGTAETSFDAGGAASGTGDSGVLANIVLGSPGVPTLTTTLIPSNSIVLGNSISDSAMVSNLTAPLNSADTIQYNFTQSSDCSGQVLLSSTSQIGNGSLPNSAQFKPTSIGKYSVQVTIPDIANGVLQSCEHFTVTSPSNLPPIPSPASCTYAGHPTYPLSQTTVAFAGTSLTKHAEKEIYDCIVSGFPTLHYILDTTTYTTVMQSFVDPASTNGHVTILNPVSASFVVCAKDPAHGTPYNCETEQVGAKLAATTACAQQALASPQAMDTVIVNGMPVTMESQKEVFRCSTTSGPIIQEVILWTVAVDNPTNASTASSYIAETCQKPITSTVSLPLLNCQTTTQAPLVS